MTRGYAWVALLLLAAPVVGWAQGIDKPGDVHLIRVEDLPPPFQTRSVNNEPRLVARPAAAELLVPPGFHVAPFFEGTLPGGAWIRTMALAPNGDVFVADSGGNRLFILRDADGDGKAEALFTFAVGRDGLNAPFGLAFHDKYLYVGDTDRIVRFAYEAGQTKASGPAEVVVRGLPTGGDHWTRSLAFSPDGSKLYVAVGSRNNVAAEPENRAAIHEYNPDGTGYRRYAGGLRNPSAIAFHPVTGQLCAVVNERDGLGDDLVPDYFTAVRDGGFYGWPYSYLGANLDPRMNGQGKDLAAQAILPDVLFQSHSAPLGLAFYTGAMFPPDYRNDAFVALHGSWNRSLRTGYKLVRIRFKDGKPVGGYEDFLTGFLIAPEKKDVWGRPVGLLVAADGALLSVDDATGRIWRVSYTKP